jgi:hypothetical protein
VTRAENVIGESRSPYDNNQNCDTGCQKNQNCDTGCQKNQNCDTGCQKTRTAIPGTGGWLLARS